MTNNEWLDQLEAEAAEIERYLERCPVHPGQDGRTCECVAIARADQ